MSQRIINDSFWTDPYIEDLDPSEKLLYLYLLTNPLCNIAGAYEIKMKRIAYETGFDKEMVDKVLNRFAKDGKIVRWNEWIFIVNFIKNQSNNPSVLKWAQRIVDCLPIELLTACTQPVDRLSYFTLLNLTLPNLTLLNSTEDFKNDFSEIDFSLIQNPEETPESETSEIQESSNLEIVKVPPAQNVHSTIQFVKNSVQKFKMIYSSHPEEMIYAKSINTWKQFWENAEILWKTRLEFVDFIIECSTYSDFWRWKLNNSREIYTHYAKVVNECASKIVKNNTSNIC